LKVVIFGFFKPKLGLRAFTLCRWSPPCRDFCALQGGFYNIVRNHFHTFKFLFFSCRMEVSMN